MGRIYQLWDNRSITAGVDEFFNLVPADNKPVKLRGWRIAQPTLVKDANETAQAIGVRIASGSLTPGSGGAAGTIGKRVSSDPAAAFTYRVADTTAASGSAYNYALVDSFNIRGGYEIWWPPDLAPIARDGEYLTGALLSAVTTTYTVSWTAWVEEF